MKSVRIFFQIIIAFGIFDFLVGIAVIFYGEAKISFDCFLRSFVFLGIDPAGLLIVKISTKTK